MHAIKCLLPTLILFSLLDFIWLGNLGKPLYLENIGRLLLLEGNIITPRLLPAVAVYILFAVMIWEIVLPLAQAQVTSAFAYGALLGFVVYGIYDMTNLAVFKDWTHVIALIDWTWGTVLCSVTSGFCAYLNKFFS